MDRKEIDGESTECSRRRASSRRELFAESVLLLKGLEFSLRMFCFLHSNPVGMTLKALNKRLYRYAGKHVGKVA